MDRILRRDHFWMGIGLVMMVQLALVNPIHAQEKSAESKDDQDDFFMKGNYDTPLTIDLDKMDDEEEDEDRKKPKKKRKKKVFFGKKTKKGFTKSGYGDNQVIELFYYLKKHEDPDPYVRDKYWIDFKKKRIRKTPTIESDKFGILHGPYRKMRGDQVIEEGVYYVGTKHGRWTQHARNDILVNKEKYYKGWPRQSKVAYFDKERTKLKEVIPVQYGEKEGNYWHFHENGNVAVAGEYHFDSKVGIWREFYENRRRKREIQYPNDPYDKKNKPYIIREWDRSGVLIYDREREQRNLLSKF